MPVIIKDSAQILNETYNRLVSETNIKNPSPGSTVRTILEIISEAMGRQYSDLSFNIAQSFVSKAVGANLDLIGAALGVTRGQSSVAIDNTYSNFRFRIDPATGLTTSELAARMNQWLTREGKTSTAVAIDNSTFTIRSGTRVATDERVTYVTTEDAVFGNGDSVIYVPVVSLVSGSKANVGVGALRTHNIVLNQEEFTPVANVILCDNVAPISNGEDIESDADYRYRIVNGTLAAERANQTAVRLAALAVPGVIDVTMRNFSHGAGTFSLFVTTSDPIVSDGVVNAVRSVVQETAAAYGNRCSVLRPVYRTVELTVSLQYRDNAKDSLKQELKREAKAALVSYINNIAMGSGLVVSRMTQIILSLSDVIRDVSFSHMIIGEYNVTNKVAVRREPVYVTNQSLYWDEKFYTTTGMITVC